MNSTDDTDRDNVDLMGDDVPGVEREKLQADLAKSDEPAEDWQD